MSSRRECMTEVLHVDATKCTGCRLCEIVCSVTKTSSVNPARSRIRVIRLGRSSGYLPVVHRRDLAVLTAGNVEPGQASMREEYRRTGLAQCDFCGGDPACAKSCQAYALRYERCGQEEVG
jgi:ferredoxin